MSRPEDETLNPFVIMDLEARTVNLHGGPGSQSLSGDPGRISYEDAIALQQQIRTKLAEYVRIVPDKVFPGAEICAEVMPPDELARRYDAGLQAGVLALANGTLKGRDVSSFIVVSGTLRRGWYEADTYIELADRPLKRKAAAVDDLACAVALLEHNFPPTNLGYRFDQVLAVQNVPPKVTEYLNGAYKVTRQNPGLFGDEHTTLEIMERVADRLELHRPNFMGRLVGGSSFPRFNEHSG